MSAKSSCELPKIDHWSIEPRDVEALIELYHATPIADIPEDWRQVCYKQFRVIEKADSIAREGLVEEDYNKAPPPGPVEITLPEIVQCFKTLVHFDWVQDLGRELVAEGVLDIPYEPFWITKWPLDDPYERGHATGLVQLFIDWWPIRCGYNVLTGPFGNYNRRYYSVVIPVYRAVLLQVTHGDLHMAFDLENIGGSVELLRDYGVQK